MIKTYIYGAGKYGVLTLLNLEQKGVKIAGFIDNNKELHGKTKFGYNIFPVSEILQNRTEPSIFVYISIENAKIVEQIYFELLEFGLQFLTHFDISPVSSYSVFYNYRIPCVSIQKQPETIKYPLLLRYPSTDIIAYKQVFEYFQYSFDFGFEPNVIVDAGGNIGLTSVYFANKYPKAKIICIEPERNNFEILKKNIAEYKNIIPLNIALWNKNEEIFIDTEYANDSFQVGKSQVLNSQKIDGFTVDKIMDMFNLQKIDLLKIDIEGAEKEIFETPNAWIGSVNAMAIELHERFKPGCNRSFYKGTDGHFSFEKNIGELTWLWK